MDGAEIERLGGSSVGTPVTGPQTLRKDERRRHLRYPLYAMAVAIPLNVQGRPVRKNSLGLQLGDISRGGAGGLLSSELPAETPLLLVLPKGGERSARHYRGYVAHCRQRSGRYSVGIRFCPSHCIGDQRH